MKKRKRSYKKRVTAIATGFVVLFLGLAICGYYLDSVEKLRPAKVSGDFTSDFAYYDLPRMTIAVGNENDKTHVRFDISLEVAKKDMPALEGYQPRIADKLNKFFISLPPEEFKRFASIPELREEMLRQVNSVGSPVPVHDLLLRQMIVM